MGGRRNRANAKKLCINVGERPDLTRLRAKVCRATDVRGAPPSYPTVILRTSARTNRPCLYPNRVRGTSAVTTRLRTLTFNAASGLCQTLRQRAKVTRLVARCIVLQDVI